LDVTERIQFRVAATVYRCLRNMAPRYLIEMCLLIGMSARRQGLRSAITSDLVISRVRLATYCSRAFSVRRRPSLLMERLTVLLQSHRIRNLIDCFKRQLKTFLFCVVLCYFSVLATFVNTLYKCNCFI